MSRSDDKAQAGQARRALDVLAEAVERALGRIRVLEQRLSAADARREELETLLESMADGEESPAHMQSRLRELEHENGDMQRRLDEGREGVDRLLAKIRFLEEQR